MIKIKDGRTELYQWDTGSVLTIGDGIDEVHFARSPVGRSITVPVANGEAKVEDVLLQTAGKLFVWGFVGSAEDGYTKLEREFTVRARNKPADYVFTPPEQTTLAQVMAMVAEIPQKIDDALTEAKESGEFDGAPGETPKKGVDYFTPDEVQEIIDEAADKAADMVEVEVDNTLTQAGQAADAAKVGAVVSQLSKEIADLDESKADGIIETATGEVLALSDSAASPLRGLTVYGKSTQDGTPTPDAPVPIVSVGADGATDVQVYGANLLYVDEIYTWKGYKQLAVKVPSGKYRVSFSEIEKGGADMPYIRFNNNSVGYSLNTNPITFTLKKNETTILLYSNGYSAVNSNGVESTVKKLMLSRMDAPYEPYTAQTLPISTPDGLCGIPVTSGGNYTDANGQQWVCDEVDFVRGVKVQRVGEGYITNNTRIYSDNIESWPGRRYIRLSPPSKAIASAIMSDSLTYKNYNSSLVGIAVEKAGISLSGTKNDVLYFNIAYMQTEDTVAATKEVLAQYPLKYVYALETPIETPLSESELAAYRELHTNYPNTTIYADDNAGLSVQYKADTKAYIDKKFAELASAIVNA